MSRSKLTDAAVRAFAAHPYLTAFALIMSFTPTTFAHMKFVSNSAWISTLMLIGAAAAALKYLHEKRGLKKAYTAMIGVTVSAIYIALLALYQRSLHQTVWHLFGGAAAVITLYFLADRKKHRTRLNSLLIMGLGFCLKFCYVLATSIYTRQNDVGSFDKTDGHTSYMQYLYDNLSLPDFDPRTRWQYCHPPLHHFIGAVWMWINRVLLSPGENPCRESIQMLSLFYSCCIMITAYRILRHFKLKGAALYIPLIIINFHPAFVLLSGSINNDVLSVAFIMGAVLCTLRWSESRSMKDILKIALCIGLGMMTKISAALIAPPVALVFLIVFIKNVKKELIPLLTQFVCFGLVCVPLGMWFPVYQRIRWGIPFTYVHEMSVLSFQYIGDMPFAERITDFSLSQLTPIYEHWRRVDEYGVFHGDSEYNPLIALMKNSIFGESFGEGTFANYRFIYYILPVFFGLNVFIASAAFLSGVVFTVKKCSATRTAKALITCYYLIMMFIFYINADNYPFTCTMNFRYITPTVITGALYLGFTLTALGTPRKRKPPAEGVIDSAVPRVKLPAMVTSVILGAAAACFAICSVTVYMFLCIDS